LTESPSEPRHLVASIQVEKEVQPVRLLIIAASVPLGTAAGVALGLLLLRLVTLVTRATGGDCLTLTPFES
jgi:hypothetical protein